MSDLDEKLIIKLGQRITEQTAIFRMIAASLHGIEANLRQMAISSNTTPNYQRLLSAILRTFFRGRDGKKGH